MKIELTLTKREADAFLRAERGYWLSRPSLALQSADFKLREAILAATEKAA